MDNPDIDLLKNNLEFFIRLVKEDLTHHSRGVESDCITFDAFNSPVIEYGGGCKTENPLIMDLYQKFSEQLGEEDPYDRLVGFVKSSGALTYFKDNFKERYTNINSEEAQIFNLMSFYFSIVQEYVDSLGSLDSFVSSEIDNEKLFSIYEVYLNFLRQDSTDVKIIIPITGVLWFDKGDCTEMTVDFGSGIRLRNISKEEQLGRLFVAIRQDAYYFDGRDKDIDQVTNLVIEISERVRLKEKRIGETPGIIRQKFENKFHEINSILTLISMEFSNQLIGFHRVYYKIEGHPFNAHSTPLAHWHDLSVKPIFLPRFLDLEFGHVGRKDYLLLNRDRLAPVNNMYEKIYNSHSSHRKKIEGALFRRTRALMDFSETEGLLDSVIGIEQLLNDSRNDISFKMSLYIANLLQDDKEFETKSKKEIFNEFKEIYNKRSRIVHSGISVSEREALKYLERLIVKILSHPEIDLQSEQPITGQIEDIYLF